MVTEINALSWTPGLLKPCVPWSIIAPLKLSSAQANETPQRLAHTAATSGWASTKSFSVTSLGSFGAASALKATLLAPPGTGRSHHFPIPCPLKAPKARARWWSLLVLLLRRCTTSLSSFTISIAARTRLRRRRRPCSKRLDAGAHNFAGADVTCRLPPSYKSLFLNRHPAAPLASVTLDHDPASEHQQELSAHKTPRPPHLLPSFAKPRHLVFFCERGEAVKRNGISLVRLCDKLQRSSNQHPRLHPTAYRSPTNVFRDPIANMAGLFQRVYNWLMRMFWAMEMEVTMVGLQNAGKTSLLRVLAGGEFTLDSIPTVGFNMKKVQRGHVTLKCWDIGGQPRFRTMWERYCRGVSAIVFIVDIADTPLIPQAKEELHDLMSRKSLEGIPLLILGNKSDLPDKLSVDELIDELDLKSIRGREVCCYGISAKEETNLDAVVEFLMKYATRP
ncbi:arf Sar family, other [Fusarium agapanthi]|uniref:Arf Sar family, other n=1 Tax=Fusarium agapanthi TaxID=1803897 RepID=A0A9P5EFA9_9HYPO|nr:arf Sar family, other [Fusarium agapanthi]